MNATLTPARFAPAGGVDRVTIENEHDAKARPKRILVVDDNLEFREICGEMLRHSGFSVDIAADGEAGWESISAGIHDLLITDFNMPRLSGLELVGRIRASGGDLPVILISGNVPWNEPGLQQVLSPGVVMQKPFSFSALHAVVSELFESQSRGYDAGATAERCRHEAALDPVDST